MEKIFNLRFLQTFMFASGIVLLLFSLLCSCDQEKTVSASVSSTEITLGQSILFADSTAGATSWLWEFGNGDSNDKRVGSYTFPEAGRYQIRLKVNDKFEKSFLVRVKPRIEMEDTFEHVIKIIAPDTAIQGEKIVFSAEGDDTNWKWEFGESGIVDSREKNTIYAYENYGVYDVKLTTENTQYPIFHTINVQPKYMEVDESDEMTLIAQDIKEKLQNIADGKPFNTNYNYILKKYLCDNASALVSINNNKRNDFYSYCQGLLILGRNNTVIDMVYIESMKPETKCVTHIIIHQHNKVTD